MGSGIDLVKKLREKTNAGYADCQSALKESGGDMEKAVEILRKKGISVALKKGTRAAKEGIVGSYIHMGGKIGVLVEVNCETDFVAKNDDFKNFVKEIAMQIAATNPQYIKKEDVPSEVVEKERKILKEGITGKPKEVIDKIVDGKLNKFYEEFCLLEQPTIRDQNLKVKDSLTNTILKIGENIVIRRFTRFKVGEEA
ncbi:MAG: translation elongation factor Ts [Candidatus Omnitrophica bacterium]|nr:translation elongation factor Ts [Candidatus Omnitrophota bacterium]